AKEREGLSYEKWGKRFNKFLKLVETITAPDLIIVGGGTSKKWGEFHRYLDIDTKVVKAELMNSAGIIGAAVSCLREHHHGQVV
ncbi:MAG: ROK family protein, partial [Bacteroidota bacterium]